MTPRWAPAEETGRLQGTCLDGLAGTAIQEGCSGGVLRWSQGEEPWNCP